MIVHGDLHIHSVASDGKAHPAEIIAYARKVGLSVVSITDHNTFLGSIIASRSASKGILLIHGAEVRTSWGDVLMLCPEPSRISMEPYELRDIANENNCLLVPAHPLDVLRLGVGPRVLIKDLWDGVECFNSGSDPISNFLSYTISLSTGLPLLANSDAHVLGMVGSSKTAIRINCFTVDCVLESLKKGLTKPIPGYSLIGMKDRFVWAMERKLYKLGGKWIGEELCSAKAKSHC